MKRAGTGPAFALSPGIGLLEPRMGVSSSRHFGQMAHDHFHFGSLSLLGGDPVQQCEFTARPQGLLLKALQFGRCQGKRLACFTYASLDVIAVGKQQQVICLHIARRVGEFGQQCGDGGLQPFMLQPGG